MGVGGKFATYMRNQTNGWINGATIKDCPLVLDGNAISYYFSKSRSDDLQPCYGGQYSVFKKKLESFFDILQAHNIQPVHIVMDGISPDRDKKWDTIVKRKQGRLSDTKKYLIAKQQNQRSYQQPISPLILEVFRKVLQDYESRGFLNIHTCFQEADNLAVSLANRFKCYLVGDDSDYFIYQLQEGYVSLHELQWSVTSVTCRVYKREVFIASLAIEPDLILAIPAIVGNDTIISLADEIFTEDRRESDAVDTVEYLMGYQTGRMLEEHLETLPNGKNICYIFRENFRQAQSIYTSDIDTGSMTTCSFETKDGHIIPDWVIEQFKHYQFDNSIFEVLVTAKYLLHIVPENFTKSSCKIFSRPIRELIYSLLFTDPVGKVLEVVRDGDSLVEQTVSCALPCSFTIHDDMSGKPVESRIATLCDVLQCNEQTLANIDDMKWWLPIATVCYWAKEALLHEGDVRLKALVLCFVQCFYDVSPEYHDEFTSRDRSPIRGDRRPSYNWHSDCRFSSSDSRPSSSDHSYRHNSSDHRPSGSDRRQSSDHRFSSSDRRPSSSDHRFSSSDHRPSSSDHRFSSSDRRPSSSDRRFSSSDHRPSSSDSRFSNSGHRRSSGYYRSNHSGTYNHLAVNMESLHLYTQWQCTYNDAILLNQVLALPLPYLSPADMFDGKRITYYYQQTQREGIEFDDLLTNCTSGDSKILYEKIMHIVILNMSQETQ